MAGEVKEPPCVVTLGPAGLYRFLKAYRDAEEHDETRLTVGERDGVTMILAEVNCIGTFIPMCAAAEFAEHLRGFPWETRAEDMQRLADMLQAAVDVWQARQGPKH